MWVFTSQNVNGVRAPNTAERFDIRMDSASSEEIAQRSKTVWLRSKGLEAKDSLGDQASRESCSVKKCCQEVGLGLPGLGLPGLPVLTDQAD